MPKGGKTKTSSKPKTTAVARLFASLEEEDERASKVYRTISARSERASKAARGQNNITGRLIECRILWQRAMAQRSDSGDKEAERAEMKRLLQSLAKAQKLLLPQLADDKGAPPNEEEEDDETAWNDMLQRNFQVLSESLWKPVLNERHASLLLQSGAKARPGHQFLSTVQQDFWTQVQSTVRQLEFLRHGGDDKDDLDDSKLYQQLLTDFISVAGKKDKNDTTTAAAAKAAAERLAKAARRKKKRNGQEEDDELDRRASKGRKIRFAVNEKLCNFTFPTQRPHTTSLDEDEWFASLFGGAAASSKPPTSAV